MGENGAILFVITHDTDKLYIYNSESYYPDHYQPEKDEQWLLDLADAKCKEYNLSKKNLELIFSQLFPLTRN